jgi:hypothetical protein
MQVSLFALQKCCRNARHFCAVFCLVCLLQQFEPSDSTPTFQVVTSSIAILFSFDSRHPVSGFNRLVAFSSKLNKMGGQAFLTHSPPLSTPRMPPDIYNLVLEGTHSLLSKHYTHVSSPIEAPGKATYGDIDIVVFGPLSPSYDPSIVPRQTVNSHLSTLLNAKAGINGMKRRNTSKSTSTSAIPSKHTPGNSSTLPTATYGTSSGPQSVVSASQSTTKGCFYVFQR